MTSIINADIASKLAVLNDAMFGTVDYERVEKYYCPERDCEISSYHRIDEDDDLTCYGHHRVLEEVRGMLRGARETQRGRNVELTVLPWDGTKFGVKQTIVLEEPEKFSPLGGYGSTGWKRTTLESWLPFTSEFTVRLRVSPWRPA